METRLVMEKRRSIRKYKDKEIDGAILREGIRYATLAPSAHNRQTWRFKILSKKEKDDIANILEEKTRNIAGHTGVHTAGVMRECPNVIMVFLDGVVERDLDVISVGAAVENMILYFTDLGLGTLWIGNTNFVNEEIKEYLGVPYETISCVGVGVANQDPHARPRKDLDDVLIK